MAATVAERCKKARIALLGHLLTLNNPVRVAEELGLLDNLTNGRLVIGFLRGTPNEDQTYSVNPTEGRGRLFEGMDLVIKALTDPSLSPGKGAITSSVPSPSGRGQCSSPCHP